MPPQIDSRAQYTPAHRRERPRFAPRESSSAPFRGRSRLCAAREVMSPAAIECANDFLRVAQRESRVETPFILSDRNARVTVHMSYARTVRAQSAEGLDRGMDRSCSGRHLDR